MRTEGSTTMSKGLSGDDYTSQRKPKLLANWREWLKENILKKIKKSILNATHTI